MYLASLVKQKILKKNGFIQLCKCVFLTILMLLHLILLPFASVSTEIRLANLEIWTVISRFSLTVFYGIVRPPFNMYAGKYCPFYELKNIVCTTHYDSLHKFPLEIKFVFNFWWNSELLRNAAKWLPRAKVQYPSSPFSAPAPLTLTLTPLSTKMVAIFPIAMDSLYK